MDLKDLSGSLGALMEQAKHMQDKMSDVQAGLGALRCQGTAGGGMVTAVANGKQEIVSIAIEKDVVDPEDVDMLQDLVVAAVNQALDASRALAQEEMQKVTGGLNIPGLF